MRDNEILNKVTLSILINRFFALLADSGYIIALSIFLSNRSVFSIMFLWISKSFGDLVALGLNKFLLHYRISFKLKLFLSDFLKGFSFILIFFNLSSVYIFLLIIFIEILNTIFSASLSSVVPQVMPESKLKQFNSIYATIGSVTYFLAPMLVGGSFLTQSPEYIFLIYGLFTSISSFLLLFIPQQSSDRNEQSLKYTVNSIDFIKYLPKEVILFSLIYIVSQIFTILFDSYEVIYLIQDVGITESQYSFSLSYLAVVYLVVSSSYIFFSKHLNNINIFKIGMIAFFLYLSFFTSGINLITVLTSYTFLGMALTLMGIELTTLIQRKLNSNDINRLILLQDFIQSSLSTLLVIIIGTLSVDNISFQNMYLFSTLGYLVFLVSMLRSFKKVKDIT